MKPSLICSLILVGASSYLADALGDQPRGEPVRLATVIRRNIAAGKVFIGTVEPARQSTVGSLVAGLVDEVYAEEGDLVDPREASGKLVRFYLQVVEIELAIAEADLEISRQRLAELVNGPLDEELQRLQAEVDGAAAVREFASKNFERLESLFRRDATAKGNLDEALSVKLAAEQKYLAAKAEQASALRGTREEQLAQARAELLKAQGHVNRLRNQLENHTVQAPFRGYLVKRHVEKGMWVPLGTPIAEIAELDPVEIKVAVPEEHISRIRQGSSVQVAVEAVQTLKSGKMFLGTIYRIVPSANARSRSFPVRIRIDNPTSTGLPLLKPGMLAKVMLPVGRDENTLLVPRDALVLDRDTTTLFVLDPSAGTVRDVAVEIGGVQGHLIGVRPLRGGRLRESMQVVVEGNERLQPGQAVKVLGP